MSVLALLYELLHLAFGSPTLSFFPLAAEAVPMQGPQAGWQGGNQRPSQSSPILFALAKLVLPWDPANILQLSLLILKNMLQIKNRGRLYFRPLQDFHTPRAQQFRGESLHFGCPNILGEYFHTSSKVWNWYDISDESIYAMSLMLVSR